MGRYAWVTLATNDSYGLGAMILAYSLKKVKTNYPLVVMVTPDVSDPMREQLRTVFDSVKVVDAFDSKDEAHLALLRRPELGVTFTKIHCWRLTEFEKCVFLDADTLMVKNSDDLFEREEFSAAPDIGWPDCFNSGVFVFRPSNETFDKLLQMASSQGSFDGGDQGLLNQFFSDWATKDIGKHLPFVYNLPTTGFYSYLPALKQYGSQVRILHFIGPEKPWHRLMDNETMQFFSTSGFEQSPLPKHIMTQRFCERLHRDVLSNLGIEFSWTENANGMSHPPLEGCRSKSKAVELPHLFQPPAPYKEKNDFRQISLPHRFFNVKGDSGELLNLEFFVASAVPPHPGSVYKMPAEEQQERGNYGTEEVTENKSERYGRIDEEINEENNHREGVEEKKESERDEIREMENVERKDEAFANERRELEEKNSKEENHFVEKNEREGEERWRSSEKEQKEEDDGEAQSPEESAKSPENPFNYEKFFPDEICINNYLEQNIASYQLFDQGDRSLPRATADSIDSTSSTPNQNVNFVAGIDDKKSHQQVQALPRFLTIPENDARQSGNCSAAFSSSNPSQRDELCRDVPEKWNAKAGSAEEKKNWENVVDSIPAKGFAEPESSNVHSTESSAVETKAEENDLPKIAKPVGKFAIDYSTVKIPPPSFWTTQSNSAPDLNRKYSMPKLRPLLPKQNSFGKSLVSIIPKVTYYTEFLMSSDYQDPIDLPKDEIGFVESLIRREACLKRMDSNERAPHKFGPLPYSFVGERETPREIFALPRKPMRQSNDPEVYDLRNCKRQMGNKPKPKESPSKKKKTPAFPPLRPLPSKPIELNRRPTNKKKNEEKGKPVRKEKNPGRHKKRESKPMPSTPGGESDAVVKTDNVDVILKRLFDYSKNYLHYFFGGTAERFADPIKQKTSSTNHEIGKRKTLRKDVAVEVSNGCKGESRNKICVSSGSETPANKGSDNVGQTSAKVADSGKAGKERRKRSDDRNTNGESRKFGNGIDFRVKEFTRIPNGNKEPSRRDLWQKKNGETAKIEPAIDDHGSDKRGKELILYRDAVRWRRKFEKGCGVMRAGNKNGRPIPATVIPMPWKKQNSIPLETTLEMKKVNKKSGSQMLTHEFCKHSNEMKMASNGFEVAFMTETNSKLNGSKWIREAEGIEKKVENGEIDRAVKIDAKASEKWNDSNGRCNGDGAGNGITEAKRKGRRNQVEDDRTSGKREGGRIQNGVKGDVTEKESLTRSELDDFGRNSKRGEEILGGIASEEEGGEECGRVIPEFPSMAVKKTADSTESKVLPEKSILPGKITSEKLSEKVIRSRPVKKKKKSPKKGNVELQKTEGDSPEGKGENGDGENLSKFQNSPEETVNIEKVKKICPVGRRWKCQKNPLARINNLVVQSCQSPATEDPIEPVVPEETNFKPDIIKESADYNMEAMQVDAPPAPMPSTPSGFSAAQEYARRQDWESGNIDYMGKDSFDKIWMKISDTVAKKMSEESGGNAEELENSSKIGLESSKTESANRQESGDNAPKPVPLSTGIIPASIGGDEKVGSGVEKQKQPTLVSAEPKTGTVPAETNVPVRPSTKPSSSEAKVTPKATEEAPATPQSTAPKVTPAVEVSEKDAAASKAPSAPEIISPKVPVVSETPAEPSPKSVPPPTSGEPKTPVAQQISITKTPPTPTDALEENDRFKDKPVDSSEKEKEKQSSEAKKDVTPSSTSDGAADKADEKDSAVVPYCDVFETAKMSQAKETHTSHKKAVEEIIKKQSEAKSAQFPPIALPSTPTEVKSEAPEFKPTEKPETKPAPVPKVEASEEIPKETSVESTENQEPEPKVSRSNSMKEEGGKKRGVISKILEIVGVVPRERRESDSEPSSDREKTPQRSTSKKAEETEEEAAKKTERRESETAISGNEMDQKTGDKKSKKKKGKSSKEAEAVTKPSEAEKKEQEVPPSDVAQPSQPDASQKSKSKSKSGKGASSSGDAKKPEETTKSAQASSESAEKKGKSQSTKISIPQNQETIPGTAVTSPTPPVESEGSKEKAKNVEMLMADESIPETPPVLPEKKEEAKQSVENKIKSEGETRMESRKPEKKSTDGNKETKTKQADPKSQKRGPQKQQQQQPPSSSAESEEVEELKVTTEEERKKQKSQGSPSKLSDQILKAIPPPRRKGISDSKTEASSASGTEPEVTSEPEPASVKPAESVKGGQKGKGTEPVPPPRNRSKPSQEGPAKGKGNK